MLQPPLPRRLCAAAAIRGCFAHWDTRLVARCKRASRGSPHPCLPCFSEPAPNKNVRQRSRDSALSLLEDEMQPPPALPTDSARRRGASALERNWPAAAGPQRIPREHLANRICEPAPSPDRHATLRVAAPT